jgi:predicted dehydrogenase
MEVIVIGLGSMGKRRIRLIKQIDDSIKIVGVDARDDRREEAKEKFQIPTSETILEALVENPGITCAIISTSPLSHADIINECLKNNLNVFTELNLVTDRYQENIVLAQKKRRVLFLSSTFLYREEVKYIQNLVYKSTYNLNYSYHIGQYLPDWHPWEDYKSFFVGNKRTNGCREIMAIEFPWLIKAFGDIRKIIAVGGRMSTLEIGYPDNYQMLIEHENGNRGVLSVDIVSKKAVRNLEVYGENLYISWDGSPVGLYVYDIENKKQDNIHLYKNVDYQEGYSSFVVENAYKTELISYFDAVKNGTKPIYCFEDDLKVLRLIDSVENQVTR